MTTPRRTHGYMNLYRDGITGQPHGSVVWPTREAAEKSARGETFIATVRVEWMERAEVKADAA